MKRESHTTSKHEETFARLHQRIRSQSNKYDILAPPELDSERKRLRRSAYQAAINAKLQALSRRCRLHLLPQQQPEIAPEESFSECGAERRSELQNEESFS